MRFFVLLFGTFFLSQYVLAYTPIDKTRQEQLISQFKYESLAKLTSSVIINANCEEQAFDYLVGYPQIDGEFTINSKIYLPAQISNKAVFILPPLGGSTALDIEMAKTLCQKNIVAILILNDFTGLNQETIPPVEDHDHAPRRVVAAIKGGIKLLNEQSSQQHHIAILGASLGGILGNIAMGVLNTQIDAGVFLVSGGDVPNILTYSNQRRVIRLKQQRMQEQNLKSDEEYEAFLNTIISFDPIHFSDLISPQKVKLYISQNDLSVQTKNQMLLFSALGEPEETKLYKTSHITTIVNVLNSPTERNNIADWLFKKMNY